MKKVLSAILLVAELALFFAVVESFWAKVVMAALILINAILLFVSNKKSSQSLEGKLN